MLFGLAALSGCKSQSAKEPAAPKSESQNEPSDTQGSAKEEPVKALAQGQKGSNKVVSEVAVSKVTVVDNLTSPQATALLQVGAPGESPEADKKAEAGNELILVTFSYKAKKDQVGIRPADIKLVDGDGKEYNEVETSGHGGVFNQDLPKADVPTTVTAVYEAPKGKSGLTLTYQPFGDKALTFRVR